MGALQGLTEFLPVSSSGHLVVSQALLGYSEPQLAFDVMVHLGTLLAVVTFFRRYMLGMIASIFIPRLRHGQEWNLLKMVIVGTIPTVFIGFMFAEELEKLFGSPAAPPSQPGFGSASNQVQASGKSDGLLPNIP